MKNEHHILTLDAGTTGVKCAIFNGQGRAVYSDVLSYPTHFEKTGWAEQKPEEQLEKVIMGIQKALTVVPAHFITAMVFTGTMNGCIPVDSSGQALYNNIIHSDIRSHEQTKFIEKIISQKDFYRITGNRIDVHSGLPKYLWLKENRPDIYRDALAFVNIKDYFYGQFTGRVGVTDYSDASLCACMNMYSKDWARDILTDLGIDLSKMPQLLKATDASGRLQKKMAKATGLPQGLPVVLGGGDGACAAHGARQHVPGDAYMNIGSSAWISAMSEKPIIDDKMRIFNYYDMDIDCYNVCGTLQSGAAAYDWAVENLLCMNRQGDDFSFGAIEKMVEESPIGARGLFFLPTLMGERTPWWTAQVSGTLIGATLGHNQKDIARSIYEGIMQGLHLCKKILDENGLEVTKLITIGGGAKSSLWGQMAASMMGIPVSIHATAHHATSLGAAFAAGVGIGLYKNFEEAGKLIQSKTTYQPVEEDRVYYQKQYDVYANLYPNMKKAYEAIYQFQHNQ